jgi:hypothetical protein
MGDKKIPKPKTLQIATETFLSLFTEQQRSVLELAVDKKEFFDLIDNKNKLKLKDLTTLTDKQQAEVLINTFNEKTKDKIK